MPRGKAQSHPFDSMAQHFADVFATALSEAIARIPGLAGRGKPGRPAKAAADGRRGPRPGRKLDMSCRVEGCKNRSRGPRFSFLCEEHSKLPAKEKKAV